MAEGSRARALRPILSLSAERDKWKTYFVSTLCAGPQQKSRVLGEQLAHRVWTQSTSASKMQPFFEKLKDRVQPAQPEFAAATIQAALDARLLQNADPSTVQEVVSYITDPVRCIREEFQRRWQLHFEPARDEVLQEFKNQLLSVLQAYKTRIERLSDFLKEKGFASSLSQSIFFCPETEFLAQGTAPDQAAQLFFLDFLGEYDLGDQPESHEWFGAIGGHECTCDSRLNDIFGLRQVSEDFKEFCEVTTEVVGEIPMLYHFCKALTTGLEQQIGKIKDTKWTLTEGGMDKVYNTFRNASIGCTETCPTRLSRRSLTILIGRLGIVW